MGKGIYVASKIKHASMWRKLRESADCPIMARWIDFDLVWSAKDAHNLWGIVEDIRNSSVFIFVMYDKEDYRSVLVEIGMALYANIPVFIVAAHVQKPEELRSVLGSCYADPLIRLVSSLDIALKEARALV